MNSEKIKEVINIPGQFLLDILHHTIIGILKNLGYSSRVISNDTIEVYFSGSRTIEVGIDDLITVIKEAKHTERYDIVKSWAHQFLIVVSQQIKDLDLEKFKSNLVVRVLPVSFLKENAVDELSFNNLMENFNAQKISQELFLSIGIEDENVVNIMPVSYKDEVIDWKDVGTKNLTSLIGENYTLKKKIMGDGEAVIFKVKSPGLFFSLPMSPKHYHHIATILNAESDDLVFTFISEKYEGFVIDMKNTESIRMLRKYSQTNKENKKICLFYRINNKGFFEEVNLST